MASSNRHWPSMYRSSLACNFQQPQPDMNNGGGVGGGKSSLMSSRCEESGRNPEPRPRWNPRPEQIRILEGIFNSGMVNPPRDEIRRIRLQLQEHGPVGDANVFYWFQNRKSRTKHKLRAAGQLQPSGRAALARACAPPPAAPVTPPRHVFAAAPVAPTSSSSSSSDRSSDSSKSVRPPASAALPSPAAAAVIQQGMLPVTAMDLLTPAPTTPSLAARQLYYHSQLMASAMPAAMPELIASPGEPLFLQWQQGGGQYLPATELGGVLGAHVHTHEPPPPAMYPAVSPSVLLGLCNEALGQDCLNISNNSKGLGHGQYWNTISGSDLSSSKTDAVSAVIRDDEKARLGLLHYGLGATAAAAAAISAPLAAPPQAAADASTAMPLPSSAPMSNVAAAAATSTVLTDQLQGLLDAGLIAGGAPPPTATVVAVARDAMTCAATAQFSVPAMRLDVKLAFGEAAVLVRHTGEPVLVDETGITVEPLQQDSLYCVLMGTH